MTDRIETANVNLGFIGEFKESVPRRLRQILTTGNSKVAVLAAILPCFFSGSTSLLQSSVVAITRRQFLRGRHRRKLYIRCWNFRLTACCLP